MKNTIEKQLPGYEIPRKKESKRSGSWWGLPVRMHDLSVLRTPTSINICPSHVYAIVSGPFDQEIP